jgi:hypothetical protein
VHRPARHLRELGGAVQGVVGRVWRGVDRHRIRSYIVCSTSRDTAYPASGAVAGFAEGSIGGECTRMVRARHQRGQYDASGTANLAGFRPAVTFGFHRSFSGNFANHVR